VASEPKARKALARASFYYVYVPDSEPEIIPSNPKQLLRTMSKLKQSQHKNNIEKFMQLLTLQRAIFEYLQLNTSEHKLT
jgi:hypothetical protein